MQRLKPTAWVAVLALAASCSSVVRTHRVRGDYLADDAAKTRRLVLVVKTDADPKIGELLATVARRYVHQKRDFFYVKKSFAQSGPVDAPALCGGSEKPEGLLVLASVVRDGWLDVQGRLLRCRDAEEVWAGVVAGSFPPSDEKLKEVTDNYAQELGEPVRPYVAPAMNSLRPLLDTLPTPAASDEITDERIANPD